MTGCETYKPFFYGHDWVGLYLAQDLIETANQLRFYADFLDGKAALLREQMLLASPASEVCHWCEGRGTVELGDDRAADCPACAASGTLTEGGDVEQAPSDSLSGPTGNAGDAQ